MVKITCQGIKTFVIDGLVERSTVGALKAFIEEKANEGLVTITKDGKQLADHLSLQKAGIKDGDVVSFTIKAREQKVKPAEKKKSVEQVEVKEPPKEKKEVEEETQTELYGLDLGIDYRKTEETEVEEWGDVDFGVLEAEEEKETSTDAEPDSPLPGQNQKSLMEPFSPDAVTDEDALPQMAPPMFIRQKSYVVLGKIEITQRQKDVLDKVVEALELPTSRAVMLLRAFDWEADIAIAAYQKDPTATLKKSRCRGRRIKKG